MFFSLLRTPYLLYFEIKSREIRSPPMPTTAIVRFTSSTLLSKNTDISDIRLFYPRRWSILIGTRNSVANGSAVSNARAVSSVVALVEVRFPRNGYKISFSIFSTIPAVVISRTVSAPGGMERNSGGGIGLNESWHDVIVKSATGTWIKKKRFNGNGDYSRRRVKRSGMLPGTTQTSVARNPRFHVFSGGPVRQYFVPVCHGNTVFFLYLTRFFERND